MSSSSTQNQLEHLSFKCDECDLIMIVPSSPYPLPPYCPLCNVPSSFTSSTPFEASDLDDDDDDDESDDDDSDDDDEPQFLDALDLIPTVEISPLMLSEDSTLTCAICQDVFVVGETARRLPCNHLYHNDCIVPWLSSHNSCPLCRFEIPFPPTVDDENGLAMWFHMLALEGDWEEGMGITVEFYPNNLDG